MSPARSLDPDALLRTLQASGPAAGGPLVVDVRSAAEYTAGHVPGAVNVPFWKAGTGLPVDPGGRPVVLYCGHGPRARIAATFLRRRGIRDITYLQGHWAEWQRRGLPVERG